MSKKSDKKPTPQDTNMKDELIRKTVPLTVGEAVVIFGHLSMLQWSTSKELIGSIEQGDSMRVGVLTQAMVGTRRLQLILEKLLDDAGAKSLLKEVPSFPDSFTGGEESSRNGVH